MTGEPRILVDSTSATQGRSWENKDYHMQAINRTHSDLVKYFSRYDDNYINVRDNIKSFKKDCVKVIQARVGSTENHARLEMGTTRM